MAKEENNRFRINVHFKGLPFIHVNAIYKKTLLSSSSISPAKMAQKNNFTNDKHRENFQFTLPGSDCKYLLKLFASNSMNKLNMYFFFLCI